MLFDDDSLRRLYQTICCVDIFFTHMDDHGGTGQKDPKILFLNSR